MQGTLSAHAKSTPGKTEAVSAYAKSTPGDRKDTFRTRKIRLAGEREEEDKVGGEGVGKGGG